MRPIRLTIVALLLAAVFAFECSVPLFSPREEIKPETTTSVEADHSTVTQTTFNFTQLSGKAGWFITPMTLLGWVVASIKMRRREQATDVLIDSIEEKHCSDCKRCVEQKANAYIDARVKRRTKTA